MAITRADSFTPLKKNLEFFSDFLDSFAKTPIGNQLGRVINEQSVNQSMINLIKTNLGLVRIDDLNSEKHTIDNKKILALTENITNDNYLICFKKNSLAILKLK